jgi:hypothetical protein
MAAAGHQEEPRANPIYGCEGNLEDCGGLKGGVMAAQNQASSQNVY